MKNLFQKSTAKMLKFIPFLALTLLLSGANADKADTVSFLARAYDMDTGKYIYSEHHKQTWNGDNLVAGDVYYRGTSGKTFVYKRLNYAGWEEAPSFYMRDYRDGYQEGVTRRGSAFTIFYREKKEEELKSKTRKTSGNIVIDAGFDNFIRNNWNDLTSGATKQIQFAVPSQQDFYPFNIKMAGSSTVKGKSVTKFRLTLDNTLYRLFAEDIIVYYYNDSKRLYSYEGISNINSPEGEKYRARIYFQY